jgi:hypothetical protein
MVMINQEQMLNDFATLPPAAQRQILDFMAFLQSRKGVFQMS